MSTRTTLEITPLTPTLGAEVRGVDLSELDDATWDRVHEAFLTHSVLVFRDQRLSPETHKEFGRRFGELHIHPAAPSLEGHPEIMIIHADENSKVVAGNGWHTDVSCDERPPLATILYMLTVPPCGGDTLYTSTSAALEGLSAPLTHFLEGLVAVHSSDHVYAGRYKTDVKDSRDGTFPSAVHPVVRTLPENGRRSLFVNPGFTTKIRTLTKPESDALLEFLFARQQMVEYQVRVHWEPNTVTVWDNRCTQHYAVWDYFPHVRHGLRVSVVGERPV